MKATVCIGTYGDLGVWAERAERAMVSVGDQAPCLWVHEDSLARARNEAAAAAEGSHLVFLDADDELSPGYVEAMMAGVADIRKPSTLGVYEDGSTDEQPVMIPTRDIRTANHIVIGAMVNRDLFLASGGFRDLPILEDWDLWRRLVLGGASVEEIPDAVYRVSVRAGSRNADHALHGRVYRQIVTGQ